MEGKKHYKSVRFNVISITRGWVEVKFPGKKHHVTLEWPLGDSSLFYQNNEEATGLFLRSFQTEDHTDTRLFF